MSRNYHSCFGPWVGQDCILRPIFNRPIASGGLARISHTAGARAVDDAAEDDFGGVAARGSSTTGRCIEYRGFDARAKTAGEAFLVGGCLLQGTAPQDLSCGKASQPVLQVGAVAPLPQPAAPAPKFASTFANQLAHGELAAIAT